MNSKTKAAMDWLYDNRTAVMTWYTSSWAIWLCVLFTLAGCTVTEFKGTTGSGTKAETKTVSQDVKQRITIATDHIEVDSDIKTQDIENVLGGLK